MKSQRQRRRRRPQHLDNLTFSKPVISLEDHTQVLIDRLVYQLELLLTCDCLHFSAEDIILGPPKTAFASASRMAGSRGSIDAAERPSRFPDSDETKNDRFNTFREKFFKDRESGDREFDRRDGKLGTFTNRRGDKEDWAAGRPRRTFGPEDPERKPKRNGDFDRWEGRDNTRDKDPREPVFERSGNRDKDGRIFTRKDGQPGRSRLEGSWFRDGNMQDAPEEEDKPPARNREWRRDRHGVDREWARGAKFEHEPEWLDPNTVHIEQQRPAHTQEDFERWKERMKAGTAQVQTTEKKEMHQEPASSGVTQRAEARPTDGEIFSSSGAPFQQDATMEKFFGLLNETNQTPEPVNQSPVEPPTSKKEAVPAKSIKSSRFAGLFSPPPGMPMRDPEPEMRDMFPAGNQPPSSTDADQEGFQRILQMLGSGGGSRNATPHNEASQLHRPPSFVQAEHGQSTISSPARDQINRPEQMPFRDSPVRTAPPGLQDNLIQESFRDPQAREREHLLRLMQQVRISPVPNQLPGSQGPHSAGPVPPPPGLVGMPDMLPHPPGIPQKAPNFLEDPAIANMQRPDADQLRRRSNGPPPPPPPPPMGYFDDIPFPQGNNIPITPGGSRAPPGQGHHPVMGIQRPPGFEHLPPPGFPAQQLPPQQGGAGPNPMAPPPGIPTPRGMNPNFVSNMMPMPGNVPPFNERQGFPRGAGGSGAAAFGPPPGMMPPPGYMNLNGLPPGGIPPMPPNAEALMGLGHGGQGPFPGNPGPQGPPPSSRHLLDMFGQAGGGEPRGGMINPGQFR